jgi:hypothetical protein
MPEALRSKGMDERTQRARYIWVCAGVGIEGDEDLSRRSDARGRRQGATAAHLAH